MANGDVEVVQPDQFGNNLIGVAEQLGVPAGEAKGDDAVYFKRNTPQLAAGGIKGIRIQLKDGSDNRVPFLCGVALHAPPACSGVRRRRLTFT